MKIPKIVHYVWLGKREPPQAFLNYIAEWKNLLPDWEFRLWNEENFDFSTCAYAAEAYRMRQFSFVSDYIRVCALERYGGVYLDADVELLRPFPEELLNAQFFIGFENDAHVETAVFGALPRHPLLRSLREMYEHATFLRNGKPNRTPNPLYFTYFLKRDFGMKLRECRQELHNGNGISVSLYPCEYFAPINFNTKKEKRTQHTVAVHHFANSWSTARERRMQNAVNALRRICGKKIFAQFTRFYTRSELGRIGKTVHRKSGPKS